MDVGLETLTEIGVRLRALLAQLEAPDPDGRTPWRRTWAECQDLFRCYQEGGFDVRSVDPAERDDFVRALEDAVRLQAVAAGLVARQSEELTAGLQRVSAARKRLRSAAAAHRSGGSCDVRA